MFMNDPTSRGILRLAVAAVGFLFALAAAHPTTAADGGGTVKVGKGSYTLTPPADRKLPPETIFRTANVAGPMPTNDWWSSLAWMQYSERLYSHPLAVRAMAEVGVDISSGVPKNVDRYFDQPWDLVITVCDSAKERCPVFPGPVEQIHISFPDPADAAGSNDERMAVFRSVRDAIRSRLLPEISRRY